MKQVLMKNFQVIGLCAKTQTISWDQEQRLFDGVLYAFDFSQDFSTVHINGRSLKDLSLNEVIATIFDQSSTPALPPATYPSFEEQERSRLFWAGFEKQRKKEEKLGEKWKKKHPKPSAEEAQENFNRILKDLGV